MTYKEAFSYIKADYLRYSNSVRGGVLDVLLHQRGFVYIFWLRLASVNGIFLPFCWLVIMYFQHYMEFKYREV